MTRKCQHKLIRPIRKGGLKTKNRNYRSIASIVEMFEDRLLTGESKLRPAQFLADVGYKGTDKRYLLGILDVCAQVIRSGARYRRLIKK